MNLINMADKQKTGNRGSMMEFFKDDSAAIIDPSIDIKVEDRVVETSFKTEITQPIIKKVTNPSQEELDAWWRELRLFFQTTEGGGLTKGQNSSPLMPLLLARPGGPRLDLEHYPFWLDEKNGKEFATLKNLAAEALSDKAKFNVSVGLFRDRIDEFLAEMSAQLDEEFSAFSFTHVLDRAATSYIEKLGLLGDDKKLFEQDFTSFKKNLPDHGILIRKTENTYYQLLAAAMSIAGNASKNGLLAEIEGTLAGLNDLLAIQEENDEESKDPEHLKSTFGDAEGMLDLDKLSSMLPDGAAELMPKERVERINSVIAKLKSAEDFLLNGNQIFIQEDLHKGKEEFLADMFAPASIAKVSGKNAGEKVLKAFQQTINNFEELIAATRIGELELKGIYDPSTQDLFFNRFNWRLITEEEMQSFPSIVLMLDSRTIAKEQMNSFSFILSKNLPIKILALRTIDKETIEKDNLLEEAFESFELGSMAVSYRNTFVLQGSILSPHYLYKGFNDGLAAPTTAIFYLLQENSTDPVAWSSAAVEGRAFPGFIFNGKHGTDWGSRFNITDNPQPELNWPLYTYDVTDENEKLDHLDVAFTYADYKVLNAKYDADFKLVPPAYWTSDLVNLADYLLLDEQEQYVKVPFIWMLATNNVLQKVAVSWEMLMMVYEKQDYWHFIQENGGVNSFHVQQALQKEKARLEAEAEIEINELKQTHEQALEEVNKETTAAAMERLTSMLLDLDPSAVIPASSKTEPTTGMSEVQEPSVEEVAEPKEEEESLSMDEPWIETPLCTTCNECTELNGEMFKYNADKMAYIADPKAGTYAQLVDAAEKCPVHIIHPGKPLNPDEADLEALMKRAEKFN